MPNAREMPTPGRADEVRLVRPLGDPEGDVFLAHDRVLDRAVVLRFLPHDPAAAANLLEAARALARIAHPNLSTIHRIRDDGERPCIVQSFERGDRLDTLATPLAPSAVISMGRALAGALATLHSAGIAYGTIEAKTVIVSNEGSPRLFGLHGARLRAGTEVLAGDVTSLAALLAGVADAALRPSLAGLSSKKPLGAQELLRALDAMTGPPPIDQASYENPYRGLRPFESGHASVFFGRQREVTEALSRLRNAPWLLVTASSGAGKTSLVRAGLVPAIVDGGALDERKTWEAVTMVPGAHPLSALAVALGPLLSMAPSDLEAALRNDPAVVSRCLRRRDDGAACLLFIDQLEEIFTMASSSERDAFLRVVSRFGVLEAGLRVVIALRSDFLERLSASEAVGPDLLRASFVLPAMGIDALQAAIVSPAMARGFPMETPEMVGALIRDVTADAGTDALSQLSFALAELWNERDPERHVLPARALTRMGGAAGAIARHGDTVLASLSLDERREARRMLLALVTASETRARASRAVLLADRGADAEAALEALIRGRLVVAGEMYELAQEALIRAWPRLRAWIDEVSGARAAARRLALAALEWDRLGRETQRLWTARQLRDLERPGVDTGANATEKAFLEASRAALRRVRVRRWAMAAAIPLAGALAAGVVLAVSAADRRASVARAICRGSRIRREGECDCRRRRRCASGSPRGIREGRPRAGGRRMEKDAGARERGGPGKARGGDRPRQGTCHPSGRPWCPRLRRRCHRRPFAGLRAGARWRTAQRSSSRSWGCTTTVPRAARLTASARVRIETDPPGAVLTLSRYRETPTGELIEADAAPLAAATRELEAGLVPHRRRGSRAPHHALSVRRRSWRRAHPTHRAASRRRHTGGDDLCSVRPLSLWERRRRGDA